MPEIFLHCPNWRRLTSNYSSLQRVAWAAFAVVALELVPLRSAEPASPMQPRKILFFTKSSNFEHNVIKERGGRPSFAAQVLSAVGAPRGTEFVTTKDGSLFTAAYLAQFDAFLYYTSGDLLSAGTD